MKRKKHAPEQIIKKLRAAEAMLSAGKTISQGELAENMGCGPNVITLLKEIREHRV